jgi:hypothetical protein
MIFGRIESAGGLGRVLTYEGLYEGCFNSNEPAGGAAGGGHHCRLLASPPVSGMDAPAGVGAHADAGS